MRSIWFLIGILLFSTLIPLSSESLPVSLGSVDVGLESFDGYQEGTAHLSVSEDGTMLEIMIVYRGLGLDLVTWTFAAEDIQSIRSSFSRAAWWRSRLLEMNVDQTVIRDVTNLTPQIEYKYRSSLYPFDSVQSKLKFVRQGRDFALVLSEEMSGAETRRFEEKTLPVFSIHFGEESLPDLRDRFTEENMNSVLSYYAEEKASINAILDSGPDSN